MAISTHGSRTYSPATVNARFFMALSHLLFLSRLEFHKTVFWALFVCCFSSMISPTLGNPLYLFADDSTLCHTTSHPADQQAAATSLSADLDKITSWYNTWYMSFNPDKSHTHHVSPKGPSGTPLPLPSIFSAIPLNKSFHSSFWASLSAMICPRKATFPSWPPKPVYDWASSVMQSPSLAHPSSQSHTKLSSTA